MDQPAPSVDSPCSEREIYLAAIKIDDPGDRNAFLDEACEGHQELRARIDQLIVARGRKQSNLLLCAVADSDAGLDQGIDPTMMQATPQTNRCTAASTIDISQHPVIDRYKLLEEVGRGGMGTVYMAQQTEPVRRKVAVKVINPGMNSRDVLARFEVERQTLALMDHPNIASVFDGGTTESGLPYFVMELVRGIPLTEFCKQKKLPLKGRLKLFQEVCSAVQHAHQKGIIHRDLKPSNVMVTMLDDRAAVKVIDFGVAKALNQDLTDKTLFTQYSAMIGTPLYMSPEQAQMSGLDVDTRSDIYSLGVILYELLTGTTPFDKATLSNAGIDSFRKMLSTVEPPRPSARVSTLKAEQRTTVDDPRRLEVEAINHELVRELDWIVMKALEKDRERRYESAKAFCNDIQRYLDNEPVEACPPTLVYQVQKYVRRNRGLLTTVALVMTVMLIGTIVSASYAYQANIAQLKADEERRQAETARNTAEKRLQQSRKDFDRAITSFEFVIEQVTSEDFLQVPAGVRVRDQVLDKTMQLYADIIDEHDNNPYARMQRALVHRKIAWLHGTLENSDLQLQSLNTAEEMLEELIAEFPGEFEYQWRLGSVLWDLGHSGESRERRLAAAERNFRISQKAVELGKEPCVRPLIFLKLAEQLPPDSARAKELIENSIRTAELHQLEPPAGSFFWLAKRAREAGDLEEAAERYQKGIECFRRILDDESRSPNVVLLHRRLITISILELGKVYHQLGKVNEAENVFRESFDEAKRLLQDYPATPSHQNILAQSLHQLQELLRATDRGQAASELLDDIVPLLTRNGFDPSQFHEEYVASCAGLASDSLEALNCAVEAFPSEAIYRHQRGKVLCERGEYAKSLSDLKHAAEQLGQIDPSTYRTLAFAQRNLGQFRSAQECFDRYLESAKNLDQEFDAYRWRGEFSLLYLKDYEQALEDFDAALALKPDVDWMYTRRGHTHFRLGNYQKTREDMEKAIELSPDALSALRWISPQLVATCGDPEFQDWMLDITTRVVEANGRNSDSLIVRAELLLELGKMEQAEQDLVEIVSKWAGQLNLQTHYWGGLLTAYFGHFDEYRTICASMVKEFGDSEQRKENHFTAWAFSLASDATDQYEAIVRLAERNLEIEPDNPQYHTDLGAVHYRAGNYGEAMAHLTTALDESESPNTSLAYTHYFLSMTQQARGNTDAARAELFKANKIADAELADTPIWNRKLTLKLLRREAESSLARQSGDSVLDANQ